MVAAGGTCIPKFDAAGRASYMPILALNCHPSRKKVIRLNLIIYMHAMNDILTWIVE
jgi:hypothetical protein